MSEGDQGRKRTEETIRRAMLANGRTSDEVDALLRNREMSRRYYSKED